MATTLSSAPARAFSGSTNPNPSHHSSAHHQFPASPSHPAPSHQIKLVSRGPNTGLAAANVPAAALATAPPSQPMTAHPSGTAGRPALVHDILSGDEDAVLSFQLAVRFSLRLSGYSSPGAESAKARPSKVRRNLPPETRWADRVMLSVSIEVKGTSGGERSCKVRAD